VDLIGRTLLGKYEIEALLGKGGMGAVWRARHALTGRKLAIKTLDESYLKKKGVVQRFGREARAASAVHHPGIVEVLDLDQTEDGIPFLVMEFLEGETLAKRIERRGRLQQDELVHLGVMLLEALEAAHLGGVIHRDLKPENIYVVPAGRRGEIVKILDFGISQKRDEIGDKLTQTGSVLGTPHYMSPEQALGDKELDQRADLYAAGVVLYECAVGDVPFDAPNYNRLLRTILDDPPVPPRSRRAEISPEVERVILWAMEKDRERRVPSAQEMMTWLEKAAAGQQPPYQPVGTVRAASSSATSSPSMPPLAPAGSLPAPRGRASTLADGDMSVGSWRPSAADAQKSAFDELPLPGAPRVERKGEPMALELDESALKPKSAGSSGQYAAVQAGRTSVPPPVTGSMRPAPMPSSDVSGRWSAAPPPPAPQAAKPAWKRYTAWGAGALVLFVAVVFAVRFVVEPVVHDDVEDPTEGHRIGEPPDEPVVRGPEFVSVVVEGLPPGARVRLDGLPAHSPMRMRRGGRHVLEISAPGYGDRRIELVADENQTIHADLRPAEGTGTPVP
jgi:serine/threonine protein kinase